MKRPSPILRIPSLIWAVAFGVAAGAFFGSVGTVRAQQVSVRDVPVREAIAQVEQSTEWRFLYRDALVAGHRVSFEADAERVIEVLSEALEPLGLSLTVDAARRQVLVHAPRETAPTELRVAGRILDDETGTALPFGTVTWSGEQGLRGVAADAAGRFDVRLGDADEVDLTISYVGYETTTFVARRGAAVTDVAVRLVSRPVIGAEVVISGSMLTSTLDTTFHHLTRTSSMAPLGESGIIRALQALPSVSISPGMSSGLTVRGSRADGFQVLLDGMPVYSQAHLFGLFDAFNDDALQAVGLFYGIAPASYQAPPGGTVSFITRSGRERALGGSAAVSNTSARATLEGPLPHGSWLVSARRSLLSTMDLFGGADLVALGLDLGRPTSEPTSGRLPSNAGLSLVGEPDAEYFDVHVRADVETRRGDRFTVSAYVGGDEAGYDATRRVLVPSPGNGNAGPRPFEVLDAGTQARWGGGSGSVQFRRSLHAGGISTTLAGVTGYYSEFSKDDYVYTGRGQGGPGGQAGRPQPRLASYGNASDLDQLRVSQDWSVPGPSGVTWSGGAVVDGFRMYLREESLARSRFELTRDAWQVDAFGSVATARGAPLGAEAGLRTHFYGPGSRLAWSPRLRVTAADGRPLSGSLGYSRNHQFLHRISLEHLGYTDLWVLTGEDERPTVVDYWTATLAARPYGAWALQVEAYHKRYDAMRLHQTVAEARGFLAGSQLLRPWLADAEGTARGLEVLVSHRFGPARMSHAYAWSRSTIRHPGVLLGRDFPAPWDRTHQYTMSAEASLLGRATLSATWMLATGLPNSLRTLDASEPERLAAYHRLDATVDIAVTEGFELRVGVFNVYDRANVWYRALVPVVVSSDRTGRVTEAEAVDVYDLGIRPSLELRYRF